VVNSNVVPPIYPLVKIEKIENKKILIIEIDEGINKPYATNNGVYLTKTGSDKRKISPQELRRLFAESKRLFADEEIVSGSNITDLNVELYYRYLKEVNEKKYDELKNGMLDLSTLLHNEKIMKDDQLTLSGNLVFGMEPQRFNKSFYIDCVYVIGKDISSTRFLAKERIHGTFKTLYKESLSFIVSNLRRSQVEDDFNSNGELEIKKEILSELIINALIHRDYYINSSIKIFMFDDRVEIISPGKLTNSLTIENIKNGRSVHRNPILDSICRYVLLYSGYGSGIKRVLELDPTIELINDIAKEEFKCIINRSQ